LGINVNPPVIDIDFPKVFSAPGLPELNIYQIEAVKKALKSPLCLIQGPPGTGKTITSASIVYHLAMNIQKKKGRGQVLVCAPSNIVVDQLAEKIHKTGVKVVRVCSKSREAVSSNVEFLTLHNQVRSLDIAEYSKLQQLFQLLEDQGELNRKDEEEFKQLREKAE
jgi:regulator of nonsense transcripts 1